MLLRRNQYTPEYYKSKIVSDYTPEERTCYNAYLSYEKRKNEIDERYKHTYIYQLSIYDKDKDEDLLYIGHTINLHKRLKQHKCYSTKNTTSKEIGNIRLYEIIQRLGGWENVKVSILENVSCKNLLNAVEREQHWYNIKNPLLNSNPPSVSSIK